ncbi:hypothetical protein ACNQFN_07280 [Thauera butanivorans]|uniref:hypothetical protein n=1 Tax=Thauera butanivorans TaxID=86174 RepID=UPI003AB2A1BF
MGIPVFHVRVRYPLVQLMPIVHQRARAAIRAALFHFLGSLLAAAMAAALVLWVWFPHPYDLLSGGRQLFLIVVGVDVVCGPLLTLVLFNPQKSRRELIADMSLVVLMQLAALAYGLHTTHEARPLFLVHEVDRFRVITLGDYGGADVGEAIALLDAPLRPHWLKGPATVGIRDPRDAQERQTVMLESVLGGRDYSQRPEFYVPYDAAYQAKALARAKPLRAFIARYPATAGDAAGLLNGYGVTADDVLFLPVLHRQDWVAVLDRSAGILGFLPGDGFEVRERKLRIDASG